MDPALSATLSTVLKLFRQNQSIYNCTLFIIIITIIIVIIFIIIIIWNENVLEWLQIKGLFHFIWTSDNDNN